MINRTQQKGFFDMAMTVAFSPVLLAFLVGALPVLVPILGYRGLTRLVGGGLRSAA
jgi:hypothetical protein